MHNPKQRNNIFYIIPTNLMSKNKILIKQTKIKIQSESKPIVTSVFKAITGYENTASKRITTICIVRSLNNNVELDAKFKLKIIKAL